MDEGALNELADSIRAQGLLQAILVRPITDGKSGVTHEIIAGERRFRASRELGLKEVPVIAREASDKYLLEMALIENLQREGLNPIEEAQAYARLSKDFSMKQEDIAQRVGKNRATVANAIRLLDLPTQVQDLLSSTAITTGHAKVILGLKSSKDQEKLAQEVVQKSLTVRATEKAVNAILHPPAPKPQQSDKEGELSRAIESVEQRLISRLSTNVSIQHGDKKGRIEIDYYGTEDMNRLLALLGVEEEAF
jgi:ParB family chromosome partitioning protein